MPEFGPRFPVYIISKGRATNCLTPRFMDRDGIPYRLVVEPQEADASNLGKGSIPARNFCWDHALGEGAERHWIVDDNISYFARFHRGRRHRVNGNIALDAAETFTGRYENIGLTGFDYWMFGLTKGPPFRLNNHVYSCILIDNALPYRWRGRYNEDTDLCLQVLSGGLCTVQICAFLIHKVATMVMKGGNTDELYAEDGRLKMARSLERQWPGIARTERRFQRPQHVIRDNWRSFDTPLIRRPDVDFDALDGSRYEMELRRHDAPEPADGQER